MRQTITWLTIAAQLFNVGCESPKPVSKPIATQNQQYAVKNENIIQPSATVEPNEAESIDKLIATTDSLIQNLKKRAQYRETLIQIKQDIAAGNYDGIEARVKSLANDLEKEKPAAFAGKILEELRSVTYTKIVLVEAGPQQVIDKSGYYRKEWVPPKYEWVQSNNAKSLGHFIIGNFLINRGIKDQKEVREQFCRKERVIVKEGYYKDVWVNEPTYKEVIMLAHYEKVEVNPYLGTQRVINKNVPLNVGSSNLEPKTTR